MRRIADIQARIAKLSDTREKRLKNRLYLLDLQFELEALEAARDAEAAALCRSYYRTCMERTIVNVERLPSITSASLTIDPCEAILPIRTERRSVQKPWSITQKELARLKREIKQLAQWAVELKY